MAATREKRSFKSKLLIALFILFFIGLLYGAFLAGAAPESLLGKLSSITVGFTDKRAQQSLGMTFLNSFGKNFIFLAVVYMLGYGAVSQPFLIFLPIFYGLGTGMSMGFMYKTHLWQGVAYCALLIVPPTVVAVFAMMFALRESFLMSNLFLGSVVMRLRGEMTPETVKLYTIKFLVLLAVVLVSSMMDCLLTFLFARLFSG